MPKDIDGFVMVSAARKDGQAQLKNGAAASEMVASDTDRAALLLAGVAEATRRLLAVEDFEAAVNGALEVIATSAGIDRIYITENFTERETGRKATKMIYEWVVSEDLEISGSNGLTLYCEDFEELYKVNETGKPYQVLARNFQSVASDIQEQYKALSLLTVPIMCEGTWWGGIGFDDCTTERVWSEAEIAVLETAAASFAGALVRRENAAELVRRDALLNSVNGAAQCLVASEELAVAVPEALRILGEGTRQDRVYVFENVYPQGSDELLLDLFCEWNSPKGTPIADVAEQFPFPASAFPEELVSSPLERGEATQFLVRDLEGRAAQMNKDTLTKSIVAVPISVSGAYWGSIGFDDCTTERVWSEAEIAVLETAAASIGSAIEREAARKERELAAQVRAAELEAHNQALAERDRILEATAAAANVMLTAADFSSAVGEAIALVGEGLAVDRVALLQHFEATEEGAFGYHEGMYEWADSGVSLQIEHPELSRISDDDAEFLDELLQGKVAGGVVDELSEPFRSGQIEMGVKSTYAVPIMVEGRYWGVIGFDDCQHETRRSESELEALMTLANCIGSAVEQERNRQAREAAERRMLVEREQAAQARAQQLQESNEVLELRDRWLSATAEATEELLSANELAQAIQPALKTIGETIGVDRIGIMYISEQDRQKVFLFLDEWTHPSQPIQSEHEKLFSVPASIVGEEYLKALLRGDPCGGDIEDFPDPFRSSQKEIGVQSTYAVPIVMDGQFWGLIGIDHCREKKLLTDTEIAVFQTIASCFASAIQRDEIRKAREAAEREAIVERERAARATELEAANKVLTTRDRWLQTTATAANELLSATDTTASVQKVLATIGDNLECDRISVMQYISDTPAHELGLMRMLYEWDAEGISVQSDDAELKDIPADGIEDWFRQILAGQWVGGIVNELDEPFRSGQQALGVQSTYAVPVFVEGELWGIVAMDHCREARRLDGAELAVFRTAASCVGSAIYQAQARRDRAAQERAKLLGSVAEAANLLLRSADFTEVLPEVTRLLGEAVGSDRCSVMQNVIHESSDNLGLQLLHEWANNGVEVLPGNSPDFFTEGLIPLEGSFLEFHETLLKGEVVNFLTENVSEGPKAFLEEQGIASILIVPIMVQGHCWGSIGFDNCGEPRLYDEAEIAILKVAAESIAAAIARQAQDKALRESEKAVLAEQERAAQERVAELAKTNEALSQTLNVLTTEPELERFLSTVLLQINQQIGADDAHLFFYDAEEHTLSQRIAVQSGKVFLPNAPDDPDIFCAPIPADITEAWRILTESSKPFILDDEHPQSAEFLWPGTQAWHQSRGHRAATCVCMKVGSEPLGFIGFAFCNQTILASEQLEFIQSLTNQATLAIHLTRLADQSKSAVLTEERNRLAREIHDTLAQAFTGISLQLEAAKDSFADADEEDALYHVGRAGHLARRGLSEARRSVRALRSQALVTDTLPNALRTALQEMTQASSLQAQFELVGDAYPLPEDIQTNLLRIGQEAATNTLRHAQADTLKLTLIFEPERVCMTICDDGKGSDVSLKSVEGFGLIGMRERVLRYQGEFDFTSTPGSGTVIQVAIPAPHEYRPAHSSLSG